MRKEKMARMGSFLQVAENIAHINPKNSCMGFTEHGRILSAASWGKQTWPDRNLWMIQTRDSKKRWLLRTFRGSVDAACCKNMISNASRAGDHSRERGHGGDSTTRRFNLRSMPPKVILARTTSANQVSYAFVETYTIFKIARIWCGNTFIRLF